MASEKRLINVWKLVIDLAKLERSGQYDHENVLAVIASQETVDAVEVKHGRWENGRHCYECSVCKNGYLGMPKTKYCPDCGAKMDGDGNGN
jgi:rubrerythrin